MRTVGCSLIVLVFHAGFAHAQFGLRPAVDSIRKHFQNKKHHHHQQKKSDLGVALVRAYPISNFLEVNLTADKNTLLQVFDEIDITAFAMTTASQRWRIQKLNLSDQFPGPAGRFTPSGDNGTAGTPQFLALIQPNRILVMPRILLLNSTVSQMPVKSGDVVASFYVAQRDKLTKRGLFVNRLNTEERRDTLAMLLPSLNIPKTYGRDIDYTVSGNLLKDSQKGKKNVGKNTSLFDMFTDVDEIVYTNFSTNKNDESKIPLHRKIPVVVLKRQINTTSIFYLQPLKSSGVFAVSTSKKIVSPLISRLIGAEIEMDNREKFRLAENFYNRSIDGIVRDRGASNIADGDQFIVTELERFLLASGFLLR